uniref:Uncharacterized protein n=1 Tax=Panagrolaimus sp. ES5 TaxID=591445 RepID=A0AC34GXS9_9BILA
MDKPGPSSKKPRMDESPSISTAAVPKKKKLVIENERTDELFTGLVCPVLYGTKIKDVVVMGFPNPQFYKAKKLSKEEIGVAYYDTDSKKLRLNKISACDLLRIRKTPCTECVGFNLFPEMVPENEATICQYIKHIQNAHLQHKYADDVGTLSQSLGGVSISLCDDIVEEDTNWLNKYRENFEPVIKDVKDLIELLLDSSSIF